MPYVNTGCIVMFDDSMTELEICQCETTKGAENIAAALNDAIRFARLKAVIKDVLQWEAKRMGAVSAAALRDVLRD